MKPKIKKQIILHLPYLMFVYLFDKVAQAFRLAQGADLSAKLCWNGQKSITPVRQWNRPKQLPKMAAVTLSTTTIHLNLCSRKAAESEENLWHFSIAQMVFCRPSLSLWAQAPVSGVLSIFWGAMARTTLAQMLMYGREATTKTYKDSHPTLFRINRL